MSKPIVAISKVVDGNMLTPDNTRFEAVIKNREAWLTTLGIDVSNTTRIGITYDQPDFCRYRIVDASAKGDGMNGPVSQPVDALVVTEPGHALFLPVADCVATVLYDQEHGVLMLSHLGRHSLEQQGGVRSVQFLQQQFGSRPAALKVWLAPSPSKQAYPIFALNNNGMKEVVFEQLAEAGVNLENIIDNSADTSTNPEYFSHTAFLKGNKDEDGRFAMVAML
jgi:copper oxidase (laccase) domain-containing protein